MPEFKKITLKDKPWIDELVFAENSRSADFNFGNIYIWDKHYKQLSHRFGDRMLTKLRRRSHPDFAFPIGKGDIRPAIEHLRKYAFDSGHPFIMHGITDEHMEILEREYPGKFKYTATPELYDYIYLAEKLATYSGKSMHGKKNHCNRFESEHSWTFVPITRKIIPECLDMLIQWEESNISRLDPSVVYEHDAILRAFAAYESLSLEGGALIADGIIVGFSMGEMTSTDCFDVHFEKADININGAYPMVCRELSKLVISAHPGLKYINREEDMGLDSLRQSKLSYKPEYLLNKYNGVWTNE